ncbi:glycosyltransferase family 2 protein [Acidisphaera sp. L21]|uniref:glycosyltransferase family 2 protein n=1 Tax=Acidisphaera sp. L21 TaxID=1641851 RepID=UPI00131A74A8|nr:glycosyltransferase family 2 protein [Acidisphaera sp. L21]
MLLPVWARHYARQVGADHCYVVDHGSTEPLVLPPGVNTIRIPRSPHDDQRRARFISGLTASLLNYYDWVIHTDVDELVLADPHHFSDLPAFCAATSLQTVSTIGFDVQHVPVIEPPLNPASPLGDQRQWVRFTSAMCKPVLTRRAIAWAPGFHCADQPLAFAPLYLFHLHWADRDIGMQRLKKTRDMAWAKGDFGAHQRVADRDWAELFDAMAALPRLDPVEFDPAAAPIRDWLKRTVDSGIGREHETYTFDLHVNAGELWSIPPHFRARL